ncbi:MAG: recombinase RecR [Sulfuricurvum sp. PC08-66]|nr:MAG: recombinase RecR [Sulfuricurvum sp. PC08-66]
MNRGLDKYNRLVEALEALPTIGKKSATRMAYHICMNDPYTGMQIAHAIESAVASVKRCTRCGGMSEHEVCNLCVDEMRDTHILCIVQSAKDILIIEENAQYKGRYFVLEALDSDTIARLVEVVGDGIEEVIFALSPSIANDALMLFVEDKLSRFTLAFTKIAQGVPTGVSLENIDMLSLTRALEDRVKL